jgi:hypothetical protein
MQSAFAARGARAAERPRPVYVDVYAIPRLRARKRRYTSAADIIPRPVYKTVNTYTYLSIADYQPWLSTMLQAHIHGEYHSGYCGRSSPRTVSPEPYRGSADVALHKLANVHI